MQKIKVFYAYAYYYVYMCKCTQKYKSICLRVNLHRCKYMYVHMFSSICTTYINISVKYINAFLNWNDAWISVHI